MAARRRRLAERRKALGYSQEFLADQLGTDRTTVGRWERGETEPYPYVRPRLGQVLQVTAGELAVLLTPGPEHELSFPTPHPAPAIVGRVMSEPDLTDELGDMYRRELLRLLSVAGALMALPPGAADATEHSWIAQPEGAGDVQQYALLNTQLWQVSGYRNRSAWSTRSSTSTSAS